MGRISEQFPSKIRVLRDRDARSSSGGTSENSAADFRVVAGSIRFRCRVEPRICVFHRDVGKIPRVQSLGMTVTLRLSLLGADKAIRTECPSSAEARAR